MPLEINPAMRMTGIEIATRPSRVLSWVVRVLAITIAAVGPPALAAMYKWTDDQGVVHYSDKVPPEAVNKGNTELNKQGVPVKKTEPAPTVEQLKLKAADDERQRDLARQQEDAARRDRALLASYTSENEIDLARARAMQTIDSVMQSARAYSAQLVKRKEAIVAKKAEAVDKALMQLDHELEQINGELDRENELIAQKKREATVVIAKYDADKKRWQELVAAKSASGETATVTQPVDYPGATSTRK